MADDQIRPRDDGRQSEKQGADREPRHPPKALVGGEKDDKGKEDQEDSKGEEAKSQDAAGEKEGGPGKGAGQRGPKGPWTRVRQNFYGNFNAPNSTFGSSAGAAGGDEQGGRGRDEGPVEEAVIAGIVRAYAKPVCYEQAERALRDKHVVILIGTAGSGRRAGAIVMLNGIRVTDKPLVRINPSIPIEKLAGRSFDEGVGYLISEKFDDKISEKSDDKIAPELAEFHWDALCHKIRKAKAHLVVTVGAGPIPGVPDAIGQVRWQRPDAADALRAHLGAFRVADDVVQKAAEALGTNYSLADIGRLARRIRDGEDIGELLAELGGGDQQTVSDWLDSVDAAIPAVLEVAALAFVLGVPERIFEDEVAGLKLQLADFTPEIDTGSKEAKVEIDLRFRQLRKQRASHRLITVTQVPVPRNSGSIAVRHVDFRVPAYRQCVIAELWSSLDREFWSGMRGWLHGIAAAEHGDSMWHDDLMNSSAFGLALLALVAPDEVIDSYIDPWTDEDASDGEQTMAVFIVWWMSMLDRLAPLALRIAILWAGEGTPTQRRLAAYAFSGELGARYPVEATKRLSQLADQQEPLTALMFAQLFATLATQGGDAVVVLRELRRRTEAKKDRPVTVLVLETVVELLAVQDDHGGRPAVAAFLKDNPGRAADIGPLWARVLYMRPWRGRAIEALVATVGAMATPTVGVKAKAQPSAASDDLARALGAAIGQALPQLERPPLVHDVRRWVEGERRREKRDRKPRGDSPDSPTSANFDELLEKLLNAIAHPSLRELDA